MKQLFEVPFQNIPMGMLVKQLYEVPPKKIYKIPSQFTPELQVTCLNIPYKQVFFFS